MRVAYPAVGLDDPRSGLSVYGADLLKALAAAADAPEMVLYRRGSGAPVEIGDRAIPVTGLSVWRDRLLTRSVGRLDWAIPPSDLVHFLDVHTVPTTRRTVVTVHDLAPFELQEQYPQVYTDAYNPALPIYRRALQRAVQRCDVIVCVSETTRAGLAARFPGCAARAVTVRSGVRVPEQGFRRAPRRDPAVLLMVGRVEHRKNIGVAAAATRLLRSRGLAVELHVAGSTSTSESASVRRECDSAGDAAAITWHGQVEAATLRHLHETAAVLLYPSLLEGFGFPPLEALVAGIPVIASDIPVHRETMGGITPLVDPRSAEAWADAIARVLDGSVLAPTDAGEQLRARGIAWDLCAASLMSVYEQLLDRRGVAGT